MPQKQDTTSKILVHTVGNPVLVDKNSFQGPIFYQTKLHATSCIRFKASGFSAGKDHHAMITDHTDQSATSLFVCANN